MGGGCSSEGGRTNSNERTDAATATTTLVDAPSDAESRTTPPRCIRFLLGRRRRRTEGEVSGVRHWDFWGVVGWGGALAVRGVADLTGKAQCNGEREILGFDSQRRVCREGCEREKTFTSVKSADSLLQ
jgi:hypothetical protein